MDNTNNKQSGRMEKKLKTNFEKMEIEMWDSK